MNDLDKSEKAIKLLTEYKAKIDPVLENFLNDEIKKASKIDILSGQVIEMLKDILMSGGKRVRPALVYYAYTANGKKPTKSLLKASLSIELIHIFLLIHDDVIDRDAKRHGVDTIHERFKKIAKKNRYKKEPEHYGNSMAICAGDIVCTLANDLILNSSYGANIKVDVVKKLQETVYQVVPGEMIDVQREAMGHSDQDSVMKMHKWKTAHYTFENPLHLGCILADKNEKVLLRKYTDFAIPLGVAFQIQDDILGTFGNEKRLGKANMSDIVGGKQTLLIVKALEKADQKQKKTIKKVLGNRKSTSSQIDELRKVIVDTGSLNYSKKLANKLVKQSLRSLEKVPIKNSEARDFFQGLAQYMIKRKY